MKTERDEAVSQKRMKAHHCDVCTHQKVPFIDTIQCLKGHKPRFYKPKSYTDNSWATKDSVLILIGGKNEMAW